ncbi:MAG: DUF5050 domain-containing protein, partial [Eubacteriales bacterium]
GWILVLMMILQILIANVLEYESLDSNKVESYQYYYEVLQGEITEEKLEFVNKEEEWIDGYGKAVQELDEQYRTDEITDIQYIDRIEELNQYRYRAAVFEDVQTYVNYLQENNGLEYMNEEHMDDYLHRDIPYILIIIIILNVVISFQKEESMYLLTGITRKGRKKLIKTKVITLMMVNSLIFFLYFLLSFLVEFDMRYLSELLLPVKSIRTFAESWFDGKIVTMMILSFILQWLAVLFLSDITALMCLKTRISSLKICILEMGVFILSFYVFSNTKWIYYILPIGGFYPVEYFSDNRELCVALILSLVATVYLYLKKNKMLTIPMVTILITVFCVGCQSQESADGDMMYSNCNGIYRNERVTVDQSENLMIDVQTGDQYQLNRDPLKNIESIGNGYMDHQYFYFIEMSDMEWSIQRLNTENFEQEEIYSDSLLEYDILGNVISTPVANNPTQLFVNDETIYVAYYNRVEVLSPYQKANLLFDGAAYIITVEEDNLYYINDKNQLTLYNLTTGEHELCMDALVLDVYMDEDWIYYKSFKDEILYRFNRDEKTLELLLNKSINFYQVVEDSIYYTTLDESGIQSYSCENDTTEYMLEAYKIYGFSVFGDVIFFNAYNEELQKIILYYYSEEVGVSEQVQYININ